MWIKTSTGGLRSQSEDTNWAEKNIGERGGWRRKIDRYAERLKILLILGGFFFFFFFFFRERDFIKGGGWGHTGFSSPKTFIQLFVFSPCFFLGGIVPNMHFNSQKMQTPHRVRLCSQEFLFC